MPSPPSISIHLADLRDEISARLSTNFSVIPLHIDILAIFAQVPSVSEQAELESARFCADETSTKNYTASSHENELI